jgi:hypothetical protein
VRRILLAAVVVVALAQQAPEPAPVSCEDQQAICRMQIEGLKAALRLKDAEITMLRARLEMDHQAAAVKKHGVALDVKEQAMKGKYQVPIGYVLTEDAHWKKGPSQGVTK